MAADNAENVQGNTKSPHDQWSAGLKALVQDRLGFDLVDGQIQAGDLTGSGLPVDDLLGGGAVEDGGGLLQSDLGGGGVLQVNGGAHCLDDILHLGFSGTVACTCNKTLTVPFQRGLMIGQGISLLKASSKTDLIVLNGYSVKWFF